MANVSERKGVVVCTEHRGVFFGYVEERDDDKKTITLADCRMCVYWSAETRGVLGLAATGPAAGSRITPSVPSAHLNAVTCVLDCDPKAVTQWEKGIWS